MNIVKVLGIELYAYHGCMEEEAKIGSYYEVNVILEADLTVATKTDRLEDTIDYVVINNIVKAQMLIRSKLLEHVVNRIVKKISSAYPSVYSIEVAVTKQNPPINGHVKGVQVVEVFKKNKTVSHNH